ncbi:unnamed protein product [Mytilus coruscus]|uniref:Uncharacterized protein n=1 Tax=Mytilus coruscus TaxID=42192 RepID=A0A6J8DMW8_MYTCO|nr:unnamed protein product [Mytilus coruscus]
MRQNNVGDPIERVAVDIMGHLPTSDKGNKCYSFKPLLDSREYDEETLPENYFESYPVRMFGTVETTKIMVSETRLEMRRVMDQCMSDFIQKMFSNFETRLIPAISIRPYESRSMDVVSSPKSLRGSAYAMTYPGTSPLVTDTLALHYFIGSIPEKEVRLMLREVGPKSINKAENITVRLEALRVANRQKGRNVRTAETETVEDHGLELN